MQRLLFWPIDDLETHSALEHFRLEISGVLFPVGRLPNAEPDCQTLSLQCVVSRHGAADSFVQHSQTVIRERLTVHLGPPHEKAAADAPSDGLYAIMTTYRRSWSGLGERRAGCALKNSTSSAIACSIRSVFRSVCLCLSALSCARFHVTDRMSGAGVS